MEKKKVCKMPKKQVEQIQELADKIQQAIDEMKIKPEDELEVFAETVSLLIIHWGRTSEWTPLETSSYAGYVMVKFMEKGIGSEIDRFEDYLKKERNKRNNHGNSN